MTLHQYMESVTTILPSASGAELGYRCGIARLRDSAASSLRRCDDLISPTLHEVVRLGSLWVYSGDIDMLPEIHAYLTGLYATARRLNTAIQIEEKVDG